MTEPFNDSARRHFVQHIVQLVNSEAAHRGASYQLVELTVASTRTVLVFDSEMPIVTHDRRPDVERGSFYGTRKITVTVEAEFERIPS